MKLEVVDLFCGIGGLSAGFRKAGFDVRAGVDLDNTCKYAFETNIKAKFVNESVASLGGDDLADLFSAESFKILVGCAPCQPFSSYTRRYRLNETSEDVDRRWQMLEEFARLIREVKPDLISMENVVKLQAHPAFSVFTEALKVSGYDVTSYKVRAQDYGVPQRRTRLVLFASRLGPV